MGKSSTPDVLVIGSDHAGFKLKESLKEYISKRFPDIKIKDVGTSNLQAVDYPKFGKAVVTGLRSSKGSTAVAICGSGVGISIAANRFKGIRAALCHDTGSVKLARKHNDANVLVLSGRQTTAPKARRLLSTFLATPFDGGRHARRIKELDRLN